MTVKRFVESVVAFLFLLDSVRHAGPPSRDSRADVSPEPYEARRGCARPVHAASGSTRVQAIVGVPVGGLDSVLSVVALLGGANSRHSPGLPGLSLEIGVSALGTLASIPSVLSISIDAPLSEVRTVPPGDVLAARAAAEGTEGSVTHLRETLGLDSRWTGTGVGVAVIDSGLQPQFGFAGRVRHFRDFTGAGGTLHG